MSITMLYHNNDYIESKLVNRQFLTFYDHIMGYSLFPVCLVLFNKIQHLAMLF